MRVYLLAQGPTGPRPHPPHPLPCKNKLCPSLSLFCLLSSLIREDSALPYELCPKTQELASPAHKRFHSEPREPGGSREACRGLRRPLRAEHSWSVREGWQQCGKQQYEEHEGEGGP